MSFMKKIMKIIDLNQKLCKWKKMRKKKLKNIVIMKVILNMINIEKI